MKRKICIFLSAMLLSMHVLCFSVDAADVEQVYDVSFAMAEKVAVNQVIQVMNANKESKWNAGVKINERRVIFDADDEISEYYFGLCDREEKPCGYVITGSDSSMYPVIEYSDEGESFLEQAIETIDKKEKTKNVKQSKIYYGGDISYAVENTMEDGSVKFYDITTSDCQEVDKQEFPEHFKGREKYNDVWKNSSETSGSNPPDSGDEFITNPGSYENGYSDSRSYSVDRAYRPYNIMDSFCEGEVCSPTAATNLCKYWYYRDSNRYSELYKNNSWQDVFNAFFDYMETTIDGGTSKYNMADAYMLYFEERGLYCWARLYYGTNSGQSIVDELNNNRPCHLNVSGHYKYGNHSVIALGYAQFTYDHWYGKSYSTYIQIADGWTYYPSRYVWGGCSGTWDYVVVIPD